MIGSRSDRQTYRSRELNSSYMIDVRTEYRRTMFCIIERIYTSRRVITPLILILIILYILTTILLSSISLSDPNSRKPWAI